MASDACGASCAQRLFEPLASRESTAHVHLIMGNLDIHLSEALVRLVAEACGFNGRSRRQGNVRHLAPSHRILMDCPLKPAVWLNHTDAWLSILARNVISSRQRHLAGGSAADAVLIHRCLQCDGHRAVSLDRSGQPPCCLQTNMGIGNSAAQH
jgi:hypothetical protein